MESGFETIGNAVLICHDQRPVLVTDPWIVGVLTSAPGVFPTRFPRSRWRLFGAAHTYGSLTVILIT